MQHHSLTPNQQRVAIDLNQTYEAYRDASRTLAAYAGGMAWKTVNGRDYLVKIINRTGGNKSLGVRSPETEALHAEFVAGKARAKERVGALRHSLGEFAGMARGVGLNRVPSIVTAALRKLDEFRLLGKNILVIGTHALYAYESVAGVRFDAGLVATTDVDLLWDARSRLKLALLDQDVAEAGVLAILRKVDASFEPVRNEGFRAVNKHGFYVDLVKQAPHPPWATDERERLAQADLRRSWLPHIEWLLASEKFAATVVGQDGLPAPTVCPDPRAFAVYKHWLGTQADRDPAKARHDQQQAAAVIALVRESFTHLPLDEDAERMFPKPFRKLSSGQSFER